jgi:hypothetical protein
MGVYPMGRVVRRVATSKTVKYILPPLDAIMHVTNPTKEQRLLQHARKLEIALDQENVREAYREFNMMMRLYHEVRSETRNKD